MISQQYAQCSWRKSSHSGSGGTECVEVAAMWRKSSYSGTGGAECLEVAALADRLIAMRDSKDPAGPMLSIAPSAWTSLLADIKDGSFDLAR